MKRHERMNALLELLGQRGSLEVEEAATALEVSAATMRRDMDALAEQQLLTRTRGGAVLSAVTYDLPIRYKRGHHTAAKEALARTAAAMVERGSVIGLSGGTTTTEIARALATRADLAEPGPQPHLTIVTNALNIANELAVRPQIKTVLTGGVAHSRTFELTGPYSELMLRQVSVDLAFIGANGMDPQTGATVHDEAEARINGLMAERAERAVVVTDSSKVGVRCFARIGGAEVFSTFLTDTGIPGPVRREFEERGLRVVLAEEGPTEAGDKGDSKQAGNGRVLG
ncbi:DeoR/GlpR family DNA-binding transcription regulator [Streptomyces sp. NBC_01775]|uniref:DeoR/GlpR family DNA-binding transcription regulator n=1 Tax=Streptomyces sp. NBC_01775 TaxID=2975939 RepID=UPI002DDAEDB3|nr:DeoR/GlpR family DNA-binding transcription regulator [Streptomyces sp. NBC_01775]WSB75442.1 DeoR/GlpR family DNA-binding transcription regulator [Streptomyces sp. NBC_01775]